MGTLRLHYQEIEGNVYVSDKEYKLVWSNPLKHYVTLYAPDLIVNKNVVVNGVIYRTDSKGVIVLEVNWGEEVAFFVQYGLWSKVFTLVGGTKPFDVRMDANYQNIKVYKANGSLLKGTSITIGGKVYASDENGNILLMGDYATTKSLKFQASDNDYATESITFEGGTTKVTLEAHVVAGTIDASVWNYGGSSWKKKGLAISVPTYVKVLKITGNGFDGWSDEANDPAYLGTDSSESAGGGTVIFSGTGSFTKYVGVTSGKGYTLYGRWISEGSISYSDDINEQTVSVDLG